MVKVPPKDVQRPRLESDAKEGLSHSSSVQIRRQGREHNGVQVDEFGWRRRVIETHG